MKNLVIKQLQAVSELEAQQGTKITIYRDCRRSLKCPFI